MRCPHFIMDHPAKKENPLYNKDKTLRVVFQKHQALRAKTII
jgi:hypothetical protein